MRPYLEDPQHAKYIDTGVLDRYWDVGGVRIEGLFPPSPSIPLLGW